MHNRPNDDEFFLTTPVEPDVVKKQLDAVISCYGISAVKIGMIYNKDNIKVVETAIAQHGLKNVVIDPLMISTTNRKLIEESAINSLKSELFCHADLLTPNVKEAEALANKNILNIDNMKEAVLEIYTYGCKNIVITGYKDEQHSIDMLYDGSRFHTFRVDLLENGKRLHGTGCTFSSAAAAYLAKGKPIELAVKDAQIFTYYSIKYANDLGDGRLALNQFFS